MWQKKKLSMKNNKIVEEQKGFFASILSQEEKAQEVQNVRNVSNRVAIVLSSLKENKMEAEYKNFEDSITSLVQTYCSMVEDALRKTE